MIQQGAGHHNDCGVYSLLFATALCMGYSPSQLHLAGVTSQKLRKLISYSLQLGRAGIPTRLLPSDRLLPDQIINERSHTIQTVCICKMTKNTARHLTRHRVPRRVRDRTVVCHTCGMIFHKQCVFVAATGPYCCTKCRGKFDFF